MGKSKKSHPTKRIISLEIYRIRRNSQKIRRKCEQTHKLVNFSDKLPITVNIIPRINKVWEYKKNKFGKLIRVKKPIPPKNLHRREDKLFGPDPKNKEKMILLFKKYHEIHKSKSSKKKDKQSLIVAMVHIVSLDGLNCKQRRTLSKYHCTSYTEYLRKFGYKAKKMSKDCSSY